MYPFLCVILVVPSFVIAFRADLDNFARPSCSLCFQSPCGRASKDTQQRQGAGDFASLQIQRRLQEISRFSILLCTEEEEENVKKDRPCRPRANQPDPKSLSNSYPSSILVNISTIKCHSK